MTRSMRIFGLGLAVVAAAGLAAVLQAGGEAATGGGCGMCAAGQGMCPAGQGACTPENLASAIRSVEAAKTAVGANDSKTALAELDKVDKFLGAMQAQCKACRAAASQPASAPARSGVVNRRCPMLGTAIDPNNVPENLTRVYKGQTVGFCCGGCPQAWDKLTDAEKDAKLEKAR